MRHIKKLLLFVLVAGGVWDAAYLSYEHFFVGVPPCRIGIFADCGKVLSSSYSVIFGIPLALFGVVHYVILFIALYLSHMRGRHLWFRVLFIESCAGLVLSLYLVYIQIFVIGALCQYCMISATISLLLFFFIRRFAKHEYHVYILYLTGLMYRQFAKPFLFCIDPENVHVFSMRTAETLGKINPIRKLIAFVYVRRYSELRQKFDGLVFKSPIGLSAGYDYHASCTQILPSFGFGFESIGTITNLPCDGNEKPRLGRLPKSKSLLVNKGFRNPGSQKIADKLNSLTFEIPVGVSVGVTNTPAISSVSEGIADITNCFRVFENSLKKFHYYELNISCPNLKVPFSFYKLGDLVLLLKAVDDLNISKPVWIKLPIDKSDAEFLEILGVVSKFKFVKGLIIGNLQKNRTDLAFNREEIAAAGTGNFSGKPTYKRSNELIRIAYKKYGKRFLIVGCGGIFNAEDAYEKLQCGASLLQLITGMIFEGPQCVSQIQHDLVQILKQNKIDHIDNIKRS